MKKETAAEVDAKLAERRKKVEAELQEALLNLEKQKEDTIKLLDPRIAALSEEIVNKVFHYHGSEMPPHGCDLCPPNLCKGLVVKQMQDSTSVDVKKQVIIYIGDGGGDFCPTLKLGKEYHIMPRKDFQLHNLVLKSSVPVKPEVHEWSDGDELNKILLRLINPL
nr:thiamine phosphate phosphatase-like protein [Tanacetum cinerariifolium]